MKFLSSMAQHFTYSFRKLVLQRMSELFGDATPIPKFVRSDEQLQLELINTNNQMMVYQQQLKEANSQINELTQRIDQLRVSLKQKPAPQSSTSWLWISSMIIAASCVTFAITRSYFKSI